MINDCISLDFLGKKCKRNYHNQCSGQWEGFGFQIFCNCECHRKQALVKDELLHNTIDSTIKGKGEYE